MEKYWKTAGTLLDMAELFVHAGIIGIFYRKYLLLKRSAWLVSLSYFLVIAFLYFWS